jgi:hypothetical protein
MKKFVVLIVAVLCFIVFGFCYYQFHHQNEHHKFYDIKTIVKNEGFDSDYEIVAFPGSPGPYIKLDTQVFTPGEKIVGTIPIKNGSITVRINEYSNTKTTLIFVRNKNGDYATIVLKPNNTCPQGIPSLKNADSNIKTYKK